MLPVLIPLGVAALAGLAYLKVRKKGGEMNPERKMLYETALNTERDPDNLRTLGRAFIEQGLTEEGELLMKRAAIRELPPEIADARREVFRETMTSENPDTVSKIAKAFEKEGATGAAMTLEKYATGLRTGLVVPAKKAPAPTPPATTRFRAVGKGT